ncbi:3486_t:CDS:2 [Dentiscutata heterogama]|uniref:3486_t:CDS:1 n=1 Tax=Dentiscutata heterogama TaxID=1316150 RepID=A0ACA9N705_9GLOM|nr:3486_t:CDS:2 [Dentiscutata heterogama]
MEEIVFEDYDQANEFIDYKKWIERIERGVDKTVSEIQSEFKEIVVRWFEFDDEYDLVIDLLKETGDRKYLFDTKDKKRFGEYDVIDFGKICKKMKSDGVVITNFYCTNSAKRKARELGMLLTDPQRAKVKIDVFLENLRSCVEVSEIESDISKNEVVSMEITSDYLRIVKMTISDDEDQEKNNGI